MKVCLQVLLSEDVPVNDDLSGAHRVPTEYHKAMNEIEH